jgi:hypothetical protein
VNTFFGIPLNDHAELQPADTHRMVEIFEFLKPKKSSYPLIRIGDGNDGTYLIPDDLKNISGCFSPGVNNFKNFEDILTAKYNINCHMCDFSSDVAHFRTPLKVPSQTFLKKWLEAESSDDSISLEDWVSSLCPSGDLILQMDIEGAEYRNIIHTPDPIMSRFRILVIEIHSLDAMCHANILKNVFSPFFKKIESMFDCIHVHPNNASRDFVIPGTGIRMPGMLEITLLRKDRQKNPIFVPELPHPLDIGRNVKENSPILLSDDWLDSPRSVGSSLKLLSDRLDYVEFQNSEGKLQSSLAISDLICRSFSTLVTQLASESVTGPLREVAAGRPYTLSSSYLAGQSSGVVEARPHFFFHTDVGVNQFIQIDFGSIQQVRKIMIRNRADACFNRASALFAVLSLDAARRESSTLPLAVPEAFLKGDTLEYEMVIPVTPARYITILSPMETALHLSDVKVYAISDET